VAPTGLQTVLAMENQSDPWKTTNPGGPNHLIKQMANDNLLWGAHYRINPRWSIDDQQSTTGGKERDVEASKKWKMESNIW